MREPVLHAPYLKGKPNKLFLLLVSGSIVDSHDMCYCNKLIFFCKLPLKFFGLKQLVTKSVGADHFWEKIHCFEHPYIRTLPLTDDGVPDRLSTLTTYLLFEAAPAHEALLFTCC